MGEGGWFEYPAINLIKEVEVRKTEKRKEELLGDVSEE